MPFGYETEHHILKELLSEVREGNHLLHQILHHLHPTVTHFTVRQENQMAIIGIIPGDTGTFTATPLNKAGVAVALPLPTVPVWTSSDPLAVATATADGLGCSVAVAATAPQGGSFTLTVSMADGSASTSTTVPYDKIPVDSTVASFGINQTS